ncbi:putative general secretion pathway protein L [Yersinia frederiksenii]|uniref:General secretion pathway protein L n=2 Tax=Yersiniaceae TaxID=1903411 RepID=A0AAI8ZQR1_YERFR|nr:putative general secretion pathway protein L [Yersinia frederiksenii]
MDTFSTSSPVNTVLVIEMKSIRLKKNKSQPNTLFICPPSAEGQPIHWYYQPHQGTAQAGELADEAALPSLLPLAKTSQIILLLPAKNVLLTTVTFNGKYRRNQPQPLAWQLESICPGDVEQLHLTVIQQQGTRFSIAAIDKNQLQRWLDGLTQAGLTATRALPDVLALPSPNAGWVTACFNDIWLMRQSATQGFSANEEELGFILGRYSSLPMILSYSPRPANESTWMQKNEQSIWPLLTQGTQESTLNLLHGDIAPPRSTKPRGNKLLGALAAIYLLTFAVQPALTGYRAQQQAEQLQQKTHQLYRQNFPNAAIPKQWVAGIAQQIDQREKDAIPSGLLTQLRAAMPVLQSLKDVKAQSMEWHEDALVLTFNLSEQALQARLPHQSPPPIQVTTHPMDLQNTQLTIKGAHNDDQA